eukprot:gene2998-3280_t
MRRTAKQKSLQRIIDPEELDDFYPAWDADDTVEDEEADELVEEPVAGGTMTCCRACGTIRFRSTFEDVPGMPALNLQLGRPLSSMSTAPSVGDAL